MTSIVFSNLNDSMTLKRWETFSGKRRGRKPRTPDWELVEGENSLEIIKWERSHVGKRRRCGSPFIFGCM